MTCFVAFCQGKFLSVKLLYYSTLSHHMNSGYCLLHWILNLDYPGEPVQER